MGRRASVEVDGLRELRKALADAKDDAEDLTAANKQAAAVVVEEARSLVPHLTGRLGGSIRSSGAKAGVSVVAGRAGLPYAGVIHFGWPAHHIEPHPFLYDAIDARRAEVIETYQRRMDQIVARI